MCIYFKLARFFLLLATTSYAQENTRLDDYVPAYAIINDTRFRVQITEQDNGTSAGILIDDGFSFYIPL
jgi:hypothetical protein